MIDPLARPSPSVEPLTGEHARLRKAAAGLEAVFMQQLLKAMRETVPEGGSIDAGQGEAMFTGMLDMHVSELAAAKQERGIGAALYRQLARLLQADRVAGTEGA